MPGLNGSLAFVELVPLVRLLMTLGKSGDLVLSRGSWSGRLLLDRGRLSGAAVVDHTGLEALEFICVALPDAEFEFLEGTPTLSANLDVSPDPLVELERFAANRESWNGALPAADVVPQVVRAAPVQNDVDIVLGLSALHVLVDVDGQRSVGELAARHGLLRTLKSLNRLRELGLIAFPASELSPPPTPPEPGTNGRERHLRDRPTTPKSDRSAGTLTRLIAERIARSETVRAVMMTSLVILCLRSFVQNFRVDGVSMLPGFEGGQVLLVNRAAYFHVENTPLESILPTHTQGSADYLFGGPQHGDIVVFRAPPQPDADYIKRIIAVPGDSVLVSSGQLYVSGIPLDEPYVEFKANYNFPTDGTPLVVPDGYYFVLGDNRPESFDSHAGWLVPVDDLVGRVWIRYWPPKALGRL
jgi:signal peptidase I